ncbi:hypothetical protein [Solidesulfovibrio sp.]|uniref:hypothetical protein n=1 Tax=Solidesulfovibrio sp. TaxID=2910990 RepID=UPI0026240D98|nr:hypothetical protein [Solidesulfovibrio sp.]
MCKFLGILIIAATCFLSACVPAILSTEGGSSSTSLGPDGVATSTDVSTLPARIKAGVEWLWDSYTALQAKGAVPGLEDLKNDIVDLEAVASRGDLMAALNLYTRARNRVTAIAEVVGK